MLSYSELKKGVFIILNNQPHQIIEATSMFKGRGHSVLQTKLKNLITGNVISKTFHPSDEVKEAEVSAIKTKFIYSHRGVFVFSLLDEPSQRFELPKEKIGPAGKFLKPNQVVDAIVYETKENQTKPLNQKIINVVLPIKVKLKVKSAPPGIKGGRVEPGTKIVTLENGTEISVPLFIKENDTIEINTEKGEYVRRVEGD